MNCKAREFWLGTSVVAMLATGLAAAPIRVVIFNTCGPDSFVHPIAQQTPLIKKMLLNPAAANLQNPVIPSEGITVDSVGAATHGGTEDGHNLVLALPTHDVVICANNTDFSKLFTATDQQAFQAWIAKKGHGVVAFHGASDDNGIWPWKLTLFGAKFTSHASGNAMVLADSASGTAADANFQAINAGLAKSITVNDEWYSFQSQPRNVPGIHVLSTLDEKTYNPVDKMGDHPISWYRAPQDSGRFYYTGAGHDWTYFRDTYWLRRQIYNAVVWASGYTPAVTAVETRSDARTGTRFEHAGESALTISVDRDGAHLVEVYGLDGKLLAWQRGAGKQSHTFTNLRPNSAYAILVSTHGEKTRRLVKLD